MVSKTACRPCLVRPVVIPVGRLQCVGHVASQESLVLPTGTGIPDGRDGQFPISAGSHLRHRHLLLLQKSPPLCMYEFAHCLK